MRKIEVDDEVFAFLQRHAQPFVDRENDVLRRLLFGAGSTTAPSSGNAKLRGTGDLMPLIDAGLLQPQDELLHVQPRRGLEHRATVTADGYIQTPDGQFHDKPSPALKSCVGYEINGWGQWTHVRTGRRLQELREELRKK